MAKIITIDKDAPRRRKRAEGGLTESGWADVYTHADAMLDGTARLVLEQGVDYTGARAAMLRALRSWALAHGIDVTEPRRVDAGLYEIGLTRLTDREWEVALAKFADAPHRVDVTVRVDRPLGAGESMTDRVAAVAEADQADQAPAAQ